MHVPKTGGSALRQFIKRCAPSVVHEEPNTRQNHARFASAEHFLVAREPAARFESMLAMRLREPGKRNDWPLFVDFHSATRRPLDDVLAEFSDSDMRHMAPFRSLAHFVNSRTTLACATEDVPSLLRAFGLVEMEESCKLGVPRPQGTPRPQGSLSAASRARIRRVFAEDWRLWVEVCGGEEETND